MPFRSSICRPVALKILKEGRPVRLQLVHFKVTQRKRKPVIDADNRRDVFCEPRGQPMRDAASRPVLARAWRRRHLVRRGLTDGAVDAQALETGFWRLGPRIVNTDVTGKSGNRELKETQDTSVSRLS